MLSHVVYMMQPRPHPMSTQLLGETALNRGSVDLLAEAARLKFSDSEIAELKRLYRLDDQATLAKTPQKSG
jgi:hypothetical protein